MNWREEDGKFDTCTYHYTRINLQNPLMSLAMVKRSTIPSISTNSLNFANTQRFGEAVRNHFVSGNPFEVDNSFGDQLLSLVTFD